MKCPTEIAIDDRREAELAKLGLMPILHRKNTDWPPSSARSRCRSRRNTTTRTRRPTPTGGAAALSVRGLPLRPLPEEQSRATRSAPSRSARTWRRWLQSWINNYVDGNPDFSAETARRRSRWRRPRSLVEEIEGNPGYYSARFYLRPHYQLEGLTASLRLVSKLPSTKVAVRLPERAAGPESSQVRSEPWRSSAS